MKGIESILVGILNNVASKIDMSIANELQNKLPSVPINGPNTLMDLAATNIQRGRDHGLQPYIKVTLTLK